MKSNSLPTNLFGNRVQSRQTADARKMGNVEINNSSAPDWKLHIAWENLRIAQDASKREGFEVVGQADTVSEALRGVEDATIPQVDQRILHPPTPAPAEESGPSTL